jgi:hypothetical protein
MLRRVRLSPPTMAMTVVVTPTRAITPVDDIWSTNFVTDNPADNGADRPRDDGANACADADAFDLTGFGGRRCCRQRRDDRCNSPGGAHGYLSAR